MRLFKVRTSSINKKQKNAKVGINVSKIAEKPAKCYKIHITDQKPTNHYQNNPQKIQYHSQTSEPKKRF